MLPVKDQRVVGGNIREQQARSEGFRELSGQVDGRERPKADLNVIGYGSRVI